MKQNDIVIDTQPLDELDAKCEGLQKDIADLESLEAEIEEHEAD